MWVLAVGCIVCGCGTVIGSIICAQYRSRRQFAVDWHAFCVYLKQQIGYLHTPLEKIAAEYIQEHRTSVFTDYLQEYVKIVTAGSIQRDAISKLSARAEVTPNMREKLSTFFVSLGSTDEQSQMQSLAYDCQVLQAYADECRDKEKKQGNLAWKLGFLLGLAVMILIA